MKKKFNLTAIIKDKKGNILSIGKNSYIKTHPKMLHIAKKIGIFKPEKVYIHAEVDAIIKCKNIEKAYIIEIYRYSSFLNKYRNSKPCKICRSAINETNIKYIQYIDSCDKLVIDKKEDLIY